MWADLRKHSTSKQPNWKEKSCFDANGTRLYFARWFFHLVLQRNHDKVASQEQNVAFSSFHQLYSRLQRKIYKIVRYKDLHVTIDKFYFIKPTGSLWKCDGLQYLNFYYKPWAVKVTWTVLTQNGYLDSVSVLVLWEGQRKLSLYKPYANFQKSATYNTQY